MMENYFNLDLIEIFQNLGFFINLVNICLFHLSLNLFLFLYESFSIYIQGLSLDII